MTWRARIHGSSIVRNLLRVVIPAGLGLSVSHGIAREHGGDLTVDSRVGDGTRFFLDLPVSEGSHSP